jgi:hypothetical protein
MTSLILDVLAWSACDDGGKSVTLKRGDTNSKEVETRYPSEGAGAPAAPPPEATAIIPSYVIHTESAQ